MGLQPRTTFPATCMQDITQFAGECPPFRTPVEVGSFSLSRKSATERQYHDDRRALLPLIRRGPSLIVEDLDLDLDAGKDIYVDRGQAQKDGEHLDPILRWILCHQQVFLKYRSKINFICWRGRLHHLMATPYDRLNGWTMIVCKIDGILYMSYDNESDRKETVFSDRKNDGQIQESGSGERDTGSAEEPADGEEDIESADDMKASYMYWGFKFEQIMTHQPDDTECLSKPVSNFDSFQSMLFTAINKTGVLFGAEMDCFDPDKNPETRPDCYVELKTSRVIDTQRKMNTFCGYKLMKYWAQSFICGVPNIIVGFRDDAGRVISTDELPMKYVLKIAEANGNSWDPSVCMNFLSQFLKFVRDVAVDDYDKTIYKFQWTPNADKVLVSREAPDSPYRFIPKWYLDKRPMYGY